MAHHREPIDRREGGARRLSMLGALAVTLVAGLVALAAGPAVAAPVAPPAPAGARLVSAVPQGPSQLNLQVFSPAMNRTLPVTLLLPQGYATGTAFPTLYAFGGRDEVDDKAWTRFTDLPAFSSSRGALVVLPSSEKGFFSDWPGIGTNAWETFHTAELPALIKGQFKGGPKEALMGISLGGFAALKYAAHNPGRYAAAAAYSAMPISSSPGFAQVYQETMKDAGINPDGPWGDPVAQRDIWVSQDPSEQLQALTSTPLYVSSARGVPTMSGELGDPTAAQIVGAMAENPTGELARAAAATGYEGLTYTSTTVFEEKARAAGVPITSHYTTGGVHAWPTWNKEYKRAWTAVLAPALGLPA